MKSEIRTFTRRELYELVWSKPLQKLAEEFGISDRGLAKICMRHRVPSPSRGYWARLAAGQKIKRPLYRELNDPSLDRIEIAATVSALPDETRDMLKKAKVERAERREKAAESDAAIQAGPVEKPHRAIAATARALLKGKPDASGVMSATGADMCGVIVHAERVERAVAFLHALATALEVDGLELQPDGPRMKVVVGSDQVTFTLAERSKREPHIPTDKERDLYERQQERRSRAQDRGNWNLYMSLPYEKPWPEYDTVYSGQFVFAIDGWAQGLRKT
ncbi:hypothetical protein [Mesorhizobium sp. B2-4-6]|uniref:hypothetical protein n=1 Tax=Mesorhizobium sp. B2-4-6 TaxID=2589943 RepID=UPI00112C1F61|nr:hypothetical protein [Mesorhizobium sp. B2-4-6]TPL43583.1 hypothetical protein FJ957_21820 [Mesorhizobium sp. B2-4-6]